MGGGSVGPVPLTPKTCFVGENALHCFKAFRGNTSGKGDLYEVEGKPYFGEMTFTSAGGFMNFYTPKFLREMGDLVDLSLAKRKE